MVPGGYRVTIVGRIILPTWPLGINVWLIKARSFRVQLRARWLILEVNPWTSRRQHMISLLVTFNCLCAHYNWTETVNVGRRDFLICTSHQDCLPYVNPYTHKHNSLQFSDQKRFLPSIRIQHMINRPQNGQINTNNLDGVTMRAWVI